MYFSYLNTTKTKKVEPRNGLSEVKFYKPKNTPGLTPKLEPRFNSKLIVQSYNFIQVLSKDPDKPWIHSK